MLILTRKKGESIVIDVGDGIEITVVETGSGSVRLGIEAPRSVDVWRKEVLLQVQDSNRAAANAPARDLGGLGEILKQRSAPHTDREKNGNGTH
jgi:carbon storage regulator